MTIPVSIEVNFKPFCENCEIVKLKTDEAELYDPFSHDGASHYIITCEHLMACEQMYRNKLQEERKANRDGKWMRQRK